MRTCFHGFGSTVLIASGVFVLYGCPSEYPTDGGMIGTDAGPRTDSGPTDGGGRTDAGPTDGGGGADAGEATDAGLTDPTSIQIYAVRHAVMGAAIDLPIENATVTYTKPMTGGEDPAGFFVQGEQTGPALFVQVDPASLTPPAEVGQVVDFAVNRVTVVNGLLRADQIDTGSWTVDSSGANVADLAQDLDAITDLPGAVDDYESEIVSGTLTLTTDPAFSGAGHVQSLADLAMVSGEENMRFRMPDTLDPHLVAGCQLTVTNVPLWRFDELAQVATFVTAGFAVESCPGPAVTGAVAATDNTHVTVTFGADIDPASVLATGVQFTIMTDEVTPTALAVTAAVVSGDDTVTLTTDPQASGQAYVVTVADTVTEFHGAGVPAGMETATFDGFVTPAVLVINEMNSRISSPACDLVELRVVQGGTLAGWRLRNNDSGAVHTFGAPSLANVLTNDLIVYHFNGDDPGCAGGSATVPADETTTPSEVPQSSVSTNYDNAYDIYQGAGTGLSDRSVCVSLLDGAGSIVETACFGRTSASTDGARDAAEAARMAGEWPDATGSVETPMYTNGNYQNTAVLDLSDLGSSVTGDSLQRSGDADTNSNADWGAAAAPTWGVLNSGQSPF